MDLRELLIVVHILLLVYWLGGDLGQFVLSFWVRRSTLSNETRGAMAKVMLAVDTGPRVALVLMLPVGLSLADRDGFIDLQPMELAGLWVAALVWLVAVVKLHLSSPAVLARVRAFDMYFRVVLAAVLVALSIVSLTNDAPFEPNWLAMKVGIFGLLVALGVAIRIAVKPFGAALGQILTTGSTPEAEAKLEGSLRATRPLVVAIWVGLIVAAALGVSKP